MIKIYGHEDLNEKITNHRARLCHGANPGQATKFIANPNPVGVIFNTPFIVGSFDARSNMGSNDGLISVSLPPQRRYSKYLAKSFSVQSNPIIVPKDNKTDNSPINPFLEIDLDNDKIDDGYQTDIISTIQEVEKVCGIDHLG